MYLIEAPVENGLYCSRVGEWVNLLHYVVILSGGIIAV